MGGLTRKPFQGVTNIIRFNWHFYIIALVTIIILFLVKSMAPPAGNLVATIFIFLIITSTIVSLTASWFIYDHSNLYSINWLNNLNIGEENRLININAGFDETSAILEEKYPHSNLQVFDFYNPQKHTEISIERARKAYPAFPGTRVISTNNISLQRESADYFFLILAAHEIRNDEERIYFFKQIANALTINGRIIVTEHLRDINNFIAYNIGFFHFFSKKNWKKTFTNADLLIDAEIKITPFISTFILKKNGSTS